MIRTSGYRIDDVGIHDRFLRWRHFGFWRFARSVTLTISDTYIVLRFAFDGRKRPLRVDLGNTFKNALKVADILELALVRAPELILDLPARLFLEDVTRYREFEERSDGGSESEVKIAKALIHIRLNDAKSARKAVDDLLSLGGEQEEEARLIRLQTYFMDSDSILAKVEYDRIIKRNPSSEEARLRWACWQLDQDEEGAEAFATELVKRIELVENRLEVEAYLVNYLARHRRYADANARIDALLHRGDPLNPDQEKWLTESRAEIEHLSADKAYNRRVTFWRPLYWKSIIYGVFGLVGLLLVWPAIVATPKLWSELSDLGELKERGLIASSGEFDPNLHNMDFGFVRLSYRFNTQEDSSRFLSRYGNDILRRKVAESILADTKSHSVVYLPESPRVSTVYPITRESYIGVIVTHAFSYIYLAVILIVSASCMFDTDTRRSSMECDPCSRTASAK